METINNGTKKRITTKRLVFIGVFAAMAYIVGMFSFPIFPAASFFKLDFANVFILLAGFLFGPETGIIVCAIKEALSLFDTKTGFIGEVANFLMTSAFILYPTIRYRKHKGLQSVIRSLIIAIFVGTISALVINRLIVFPLYASFLKMDAKVAFNLYFWFCLAFNIIKTSVVSLLTLLLYKRLSKFIHKIEDKDFA